MPLAHVNHHVLMWIDGLRVADCVESALPDRLIPGFGNWQPDAAPLDCINFCIFFGGSGPQYDSPSDQTVSVRNMILYGSD